MPEPDTIDVEMPDGTIITGVPRNARKADVMRRYEASVGRPAMPPPPPGSHPFGPMAGRLGMTATGEPQEPWQAFRETVGIPSWSEFKEGMAWAARAPGEVGEEAKKAGLAIGERTGWGILPLAAKRAGERTGAAIMAPEGEFKGVAHRVAATLEAPLPIPLGIEKTGEKVSVGRLQEAGATGLGTLFNAAMLVLPAKKPLKIPPPRGITQVKVAGVAVPQAAGEASQGFLINKVRGVLEGSLVGKSLRELSMAQREAVSTALNRLAERVSFRLSRGKFETPHAAFEAASEALKTRARTLYEGIKSVTQQLKPTAPARVQQMVGPAKARFLQWQAKSKALADTIKGLLSEQDISELFVADPQLSSALRSRLANLQMAERVAAPFETYQGARTSLMTLRRQLMRTGETRAGGLAGQAIEAVDSAAESMLKAIDAQRGAGSNLAGQWRSANKMWRRAMVTDDLAESLRGIMEGIEPSIQARAGMKPVPQRIGGEALIKRINDLEPELVRVYGQRTVDEMKTLGEVMRRAQKVSPQNFAGHFMTLGTLSTALSLPILAVYAPELALKTGLALGTSYGLARTVASAMANPLGRSALQSLFRSPPYTPAAIISSIRVLEGAVQQRQADEREAEKADAQRAQPSGLKGKAAERLLLDAKEGRVPAREADRRTRANERRYRPTMGPPFAPPPPPPSEER